MSMKTVLKCLVAVLVVSGCTQMTIPKSDPVTLDRPWILMPVTNLTQSPFAGERLESLLMTELKAMDIPVFPYPHYRQNSLTSLLDGSVRQKDAMVWAAGTNSKYVISGSVEEWGYHRGAAGDPSVSITIWIKSSGPDQRLIWQATASKVGLGYQNIHGVANVLVKKMLKKVKLDGDLDLHQDVELRSLSTEPNSSLNSNSNVKANKRTINEYAF